MSYFTWSRWVASAQIVIVAALLGVVGESLWLKVLYEVPLEAVWTRWAYRLGKDIPMPAFAQIPAGSFEMGSMEGGDSELPVRTVTIGTTFDLAETEVTFDQYDAFALATGRRRPNDSGWGRDSLPVINVDFDDARAYATWLGAMTGRACRLPSEAEWEYACRAGTTTAYAFGDELKAEQANIDGSGIDRTSKVRRFPANQWGLFDMHGNVYEWIEDCWHDDYQGAPTDGEAWRDADSGNCGLRVLRGGSWFLDQFSARCAARLRVNPDYRPSNVGFRVVCSSPILGTDP